MRRTVLATFVLALTIFSVKASSQPPDTLWTRTYGGAGTDWGFSVQQTAEGGYIVAGYTDSFGAGGNDVYLVKTDASGDTLWTRTYGGGNNDGCYSVEQTADGGYIVAGQSNSFGGSDLDVYLIKTDASGDTLWTRTYGGTNNDVGFSVKQTADGGYIVAGQSNSFGGGTFYFYLIKTDASGDTLWTRTYGGTGEEYGLSVQQTADGGYIVAGPTDSFGAGSYDVYLVKTDASGDTLWTRTYGGTSFDWGSWVQQTADGGYIVAGETYSFGAGGSDVYLIKTDASGDTLWTRTYGGTSNDDGLSVQQTADGGYIVAGETYSFGAGGWDVYLVKTDASGDTLWTRTYGGTGTDWGHSVQQTADHGYIVAGATYSFGPGPSSVYLIRLDSETGIGDKDNEPILRGFALSQNYPNPFNAATVIQYSLPEPSEVTIQIYDILGRSVGTLFEGIQEAGHHSFIWDAGDFPSGIYFVRLVADSRSEVKRMTLLK